MDKQATKRNHVILKFLQRKRRKNTETVGCLASVTPLPKHVVTTDRDPQPPEAA
ncbi:hypothetical protein [Solemya elarraichensis gill symbiont]|uniref:hypothetical protein n=1 Tax=Solemya elarraichensis gill symbiont TaxID=1918949 RepID=UPI001428A2E5|nr:hypothetical protein [Solemya elarraichensis gill symbiont]